jgi:hypothetical protein
MTSTCADEIGGHMNGANAIPMNKTKSLVCMALAILPTAFGISSPCEGSERLNVCPIVGEFRRSFSEFVVMRLKVVTNGFVEQRVVLGQWSCQLTKRIVEFGRLNEERGVEGIINRHSVI